MSSHSTTPVRPNGNPCEDKVCPTSASPSCEGDGQDGGQNANSQEDDIEEGIEINGLPNPKCPSKAERERHELTHFPYRSWCDACVKGRGQANSHPSANDREDGYYSIPQLGADYCFLGAASGQQDMVGTNEVPSSSTASRSYDNALVIALGAAPQDLARASGASKGGGPSRRTSRDI